MNKLAVKVEENFSDLMENSTSLNQLNEILFRECRKHGITKFILHDFLKYKDYKRLYSMTSPDLEEWRDVYQVQKEYDIIDPIYDKTYHSFCALYWNENVFSKLTQKQREFFSDLKRFGISSGTTFSLIPQMIKEEELLSGDSMPCSSYQHNRFFTVLNQDLSNNMDLIYKLSVIGNTYNLKKESFTYDKFSKPLELEKDDTNYALLYSILSKGIYSLESKGLVTFDIVYRQGVDSLLNDNNDELERKIH